VTNQWPDGVDRIELRGLRAIGYHGVFDHERHDGQEFVVDVVLGVDTRAAAASDDLADTVDYGAVANDVTAIVEGEPLNLIESLANRIAAALLQRPLVQAVEVRVHKPHAPITVAFEDVVVAVVRIR
jgi:7,8-dihydroneopterin aldolase/epimerase/oxygenase